MKDSPQILIVDDDRYILKVMKRLLSKYLINIITTSSPYEALDIIKDGKVDLIISDYKMPGMEGLQLLSKVKELCPTTIRILMSGYSDVDLLVDAINSGSISNYIAKPWENDKLLRMIFKALIDQVDYVEQNFILNRIFQGKVWTESLSLIKYAQRKDVLNKIMMSQHMITDDILEEARVLGVELLTSYYLGMITMETTDVKLTESAARLTELIFVINMLPSCIAWDNREAIMIIFEAEPSDNNLNMGMLNHIKVLITSYITDHYFIGISNIHNCAYELNAGYKQAYSANVTAKCLSHTMRVMFYKDIGVYQLLTKLYGQAETDEFIKDTLGRLILYDKEKGSDYIHTLEELLRSINLKEAAARLYIHPKTIIFRRERIEKILEISLDDYETRLSLGIALKLLKIKSI